MIKREITVLYKQTILGFLWAIIRPVFTMIIFSVVFGNLAKIPSDGIPYPVFSYVALVPWTYFSTALTKSSQSLITGGSMLSKVYFPRLIMPLAPVLAGIVDFLISLSVVGVLLIYFKIIPTFNIVWLPFLIVIMILSSTGIGLWLSALAVQYRDVRYAVQFLTQLLMYAAPVVWPVSIFSEKFGDELTYLYSLYPMVGVIEGFRSALIGKASMPIDIILIGFLSSLLIFISGSIYFHSKEKNFCRCCMSLL